MRPKRSSSHDALSPTEYVFEIVWSKNARFFGVRCSRWPRARIDVGKQRRRA